MGQETFNQIKELTDKVNQLLQERDFQEEPEDPYVTARIPVTDLAIYPELLEALPSIEEEFFRSPLTDEERKSAIYSCPKTSSMNYNLPPLNDSASSAVKKTDSALYGIQLALAQATRPIDFYVYRRIQDNSTLDIADDPEIMFASTMRALLSDIAATVTQTRPVCFSPKQEGGSIFELVLRPQSRRTECVSTQLVKVGQPILLPTLEPNIASNPQSTQRENNHDTGYSNVEIGNMVSGSIDSVDFLTVIASSNNSCSRSQKRKVSAIEQQTLALDGMEDQRRFLQTQGLGTYAVGFILSNKRRVRRRSRYSSIQQRFLDWRILNKITTDISAPQIINYLSELFIMEKLKVGTIKTYKLAILSLADNSIKLAEHPMFAEFTKTLDDSSIKSFLTAKLCWLLSVTGFLRASDIHCIDDARSLINQGVLCLTIVAPKEKRGGRPVEKPCQINPHTDPILCPVLTYTVYKEKVAHNLCPTPHVNNSMWTVNRLIRFFNDRERPLSVDSITRYINSISGLIQQDQDMPISKGRAIGATLAANSGVSSDYIVAHAFWSNYSIFDSYY
ncbi:hypothetical protein BB561_004608 [Smittium simulii]|uniref:Uncharacterized protein n=1 Tax=Smittium simulii TaxID=133385 RepID=A0A2T9YFB7_9FUNG|nr:hypothetical protein BB561_004608 [Smittium simulii]